MNMLQDLVSKDVFAEESVSTSATSNSSGIDTLGLGDALFVVIPTTLDGAPTAVKVQDSPDNSAWADVSGAALSDFPGASDDGKRYAIFVSKAGTAHDRYLRLVYTQGGSGSSTVTATAFFSNANEQPNSATDRGYEAEAIA